MTTEVAIINRAAIALAADSAVTVSLIVGKTLSSGRKIFNTANKLFALSRFEPIGIMVYGNASLSGIPWEALIKVYRFELGERYFSTVEEYALDFIDFMSRNTDYFLMEDQELTLSEIVYRYLIRIKQSITNEALRIKENSSDGKVTSSKINALINNKIEYFKSVLEDKEFAIGFDKLFCDNLIKSSEKIIDSLINEAFEDLKITQVNRKKLRKIAALSVGKNYPIDSYSGIVIAGFGRSQMTPDLKPYKMEGVINGKLKYSFDDSKEYSNRPNSSIIPFAQEDMIFTFVAGLSSNLLDVQIRSVENILAQWFRQVVNQPHISDSMKEILESGLEQKKNELVTQFFQEIKNYQQDKFIEPVMQTVSNLPKEELAEMAEALVSLTSLRRKVSTDEETVGGPTDVAIISKGDGFIWYKRKHYFESSLNQDFFARRNAIRYDRDKA